MTTFSAAVLHATNTKLALEEVSIPEIGPDDVLVRLKASGLCHTDLEVIQGALPYPLPIVLGHEGAGVVEAVGATVASVKPGDHVICSWNPNCGRCFYCDGGQPILCEPFTTHQPQGRLLDGGTRLRIGGEPLHHFSMVCSHAEYCVVPQTGAVPVSRDIPFSAACLIGCGVMTGVGAATRMAPMKAGDRAVVIGCGAVGLNVVQGARLAGADTIIAVDIADDKLAMAETLGATHAFNPNRADVVDEVRRLTAGRGADHVFEAAGIVNTLQLSLDCTRPGGTLTLLGKTAANHKVEIRWGSMMGERRIVRSSYGGARPRRDFPYLAKLYLDGRLKLDELITRRIRLADINAGFDDMAAGKGVRTVIEFD